MIRFLKAILLLALALYPAAAPAHAAQQPAFERSLIGVVTAANGARVQVSGSAKATLLGVLDPGERIIVTGRTSDNVWVRVQSRYGEGYLRVNDAKLIAERVEDMRRIAVVAADMPVAPPPPDTPTRDAERYPILPTLSAYVGEIYRRGQALGNRPAIFTKVGDCMTSDELVFLGRFATPNYDLGEYTELQRVIDFYSKESPRPGQANSFAEQSIAAYNGFNAAAVLDPTWLEPGLCAEGTSPLACEYQLARPAVAIIMFGTNDVLTLNSTQFEFYMRLIVHETIARGIIPVLSTFPGNHAIPGRANRFNQAVYRVGQDYDVPVINLWLALQALPGKGIDDKAYLSRSPSTRVSHFTPENLKYGYTMRNLLTLQTLDLLLEQVIGIG